MSNEKNKKWLYLIILFPIATICILLIFKAIPSTIQQTGDAVSHTANDAVKETYQTGKEIAQDIATAIDNAIHAVPRVTYNGTMVLGEKTSILELSTVEQSIKHEYEWEHEWLGSRKKIRITGFLTAKAGFDLNKYFQLNIQEEQGKYSINIYVPPAKLLSVELKPNFEVWSANGWWNKVHDEERNAVINTFLQDAKIHIAQGSLIDTAMENLEKQINQIIKARIHNGEILYSHETPSLG